MVQETFEYPGFPILQMKQGVFMGYTTLIKICYVSFLKYIVESLTEQKSIHATV